VKKVQCEYPALLLVALLPCIVIAQPEGARRLSTEEIRQAFANVHDTARVQNSSGTTAVNQWFADGRLINNWSNSSASGTVTARWYVENGMRCVLIQSGIPAEIGKKKCGPVYQRGMDYFSVNADGSIHGIHRLSPMKPSDSLQ